MIASIVPISPTLCPTPSKIDRIRYVVVVFPFVPVNSDHFQLLCRISEIRRRHQRQRISRIFRFDHRHPFRCLDIPFCYNRRRAFFCHIRNILMPVKNRSADTDKNRSAFYFSESFASVVTSFRHSLNNLIF